MKRAQFVNMIALAESHGKVRAFGDSWRASGLYQMHMEWRADYWPAWGWEVLALVDRYAIEHFIACERDGTPRKPTTARALADLYNLGHAAADPEYDLRCLMAMESMGITQDEFDTVVE